MNKTLKTVLKVVAFFLLFVFAITFTVPFIFEDKIAKKVISIVNEELNAEVSIDKLNLTLYRHFPDFTLQLKNLKVKNKNNFQDTILVQIEKFEVILGLADVMKGNLKIKTIGIIKPNFNIIVDSLGYTNYDITKKDTISKINEEKTDKTSEVSEKSKSDFKISLEEFFIENANISYTDNKSKIIGVITNLNHRTKGDFTLTKFIAETKTSIADIYFSKAGIIFLKEANFYANLNADIDTENSRYQIMQNEIGLNKIKFNFDGEVYMKKEESMDIDLKFNTSEVEFKDLLSMIPGAFRHHIKDLNTSGKFEILGKVKGKYNENLMPAMDISLLVKDGFIQYPKLPKSINDINIKIDINKNESKDLDALVIDVSRFDLDFGGNPIKLYANVKTPISDPDLKVDLLAKIDLLKLKDVIPLGEKDKVTGKINTDVHLKGKLSYIDKKQYDKFYAKGTIDLTDILYSSDVLPFKEVKVNKLLFNFSPQTLDLNEVDILAGNSDLKMNGKVSNYLGFIFKEQVLTGTLNINSNSLLLDELAGGKDKKEEKTTNTIAKTENVKESESKEMKAVLIPDRINFNTNLNLSKVNYGDIKMLNVKGDLGIANKTAYLKKLSLNILEGKVILNGNYNTKNEKIPKVDMDMDISKLDIENTINTFQSLKSIAPQVVDTKGKFSANINMKTDLTEDMKPNFKTLYSKGGIKTQDINMKTSGALKSIGDALNSKALQNPKVEDLNISYTIEKGVLKISPIVIKSGELIGTIEGESYIETQIVNMIGKFEVPRKELGALNKGIDEALVLANKNNIKISMTDKIGIKVKIHGKVTSPEYTLLYGPKESTSLQGYINEEIEELKKKATEKAKDEIKDNVKKEAEKIYKKNEDKIKDKLKKLF